MSFRSAVLTLIAMTAIQLNAEDRKYVVGTTLDLVGGGTSGQNSFGGFNQRGSFFYEAYPSIQIRSLGAHSSLDLSYVYGWSQLHSDVRYDTNSHGISAAFSSSLGPKWKLNLSESFQMARDFTTFNATRGVVSTPANFVFNPAAYNRSTQFNNAAVEAEYVVNERATLSFIGSHSRVHYPQHAAFHGILSDQQRASETVTYSKKLTEHGGWTLGYTGAYMDFKGQFANANSHALSAGYFHQIGRDLTVRVTAGPSYVKTANSVGNYIGYNAQASLQKPVKSNTFSLYYAHDSGQSSGLGSISDNDRAGFGLTRITKSATFFADISAFDVRGRLGTAYSTRGVSAAANIGMTLTRRLSLHWGGQYQRYDNTSIFGFAQKRIYVSLRFSSPELWKRAR